MSSLDQEFHRRLVKKIDEVDKQATEHLRGGTLDHEEYKKKSGYVQALDNVRAWCDEIEQNINEGK